MTMNALSQVKSRLLDARKGRKGKKVRYSVPSLWSGSSAAAKRHWVDPFQYYLSVIRRIERAAPVRRRKVGGGEWSRTAVVYNLFVRTTTAFDHDGNGKLDLPVNASGFRETGTFLKSIAILPYLRSLGMDTLHLLPITSVGHDGNKGTLGSPYAIRNPREIEESLSEPILGLGAATEFRAFVEAAHRLGFRVVLEFVFRTAAKDSDWVREHPDWFYWIREEVETRTDGSDDEARYGSPVFTRDELARIHDDVRNQRMENLVPPHASYIDFFRMPPPREGVEKLNGRYRGHLDDGQRLKIPGAFADWPPDDSQPPWGDVTYLRMYRHPDFNYMAYNTIRMYDHRLSNPDNANTELWESIAGTIPFFQKHFRIDGVMIDMGHALPMALKKMMISRAREIDPDFAFWDENFSVSRQSREEGYNAVVGYLWMDQHDPARMKNFLRTCSKERFPLSFFAGAETHNTPRAATRSGGTRFSGWSWVINCFLPGIPFLHSGFELEETLPINTGLDFTPEQLRHLPAERLPLFSEHAYDWCRRTQLPTLVARVVAIRRRFLTVVSNPDPESLLILADENPLIVAFARRSPSGKGGVAIVTNADFTTKQTAHVVLNTKRRSIVDLLTRKRIFLKGRILSKVLKPGQCLVFEY